jgi:hypothetical protein
MTTKQNLAAEYSIQADNESELETEDIQTSNLINVDHGKPKRTNIGLLYMLLGSLSMSMMNVSAKLINRYTDVTVLEVCYFRGVIMAFGCTLHSYCA